MAQTVSVSELVARIAALPVQDNRKLVALVGPPASGKSTLAAQICDALNARGETCQVVPMDGFHLDNRLLDQRGLRARKGSPDSFDALGFLHLIRRLPGEAEVIYPLFDRAQDLAIAGAATTSPACRTVIVEGNYLLLDRPVWRELRTHWDLSVALVCDREVLQTRLLARWRAHGLSETKAKARAEANDLPNADLVLNQSFPPDLYLASG